MRSLIGALLILVASPVLADEARLRERHGYSDAEVAALRPNEVSAATSPTVVERSLYARVFARHLGPPEPVEAPFARYVNPDGSEIATDASLPSPTIRVDMNGGAYPVLSVPPAVNAKGQPLLVLWEFDVSPSFDTPNMWRSPALLPLIEGDDLPTRAGLTFYLQTALDSTGRATKLSFPFRAWAMRLPHRQADMRPEDLFKQARALGWGMSEDALIQEVFHFVRHVYPWSSDVLPHSPFDTFVSGLGECGYVNQLAGAMLETNGLHVRSVSGFSPLARTVYPGGGHTAIEVWRPGAGKWSYFDPYLNLRLDGPIAEASLDPRGERSIYALDPSLHEALGPDLGLAELFRYRRYFDTLVRSTMIHMHDLEDEAAYGRDWPLLEGPDYGPEELWSDPFTVYVRARYVDTDGQPITINRRTATFSPAGHTRFTVDPLGYLRGQTVAQLDASSPPSE